MGCRVSGFRAECFGLSRCEASELGDVVLTLAGSGLGCWE